MRKVIVAQFMTLDGIIEAPHTWAAPYWEDELGYFKHDELAACDALLLGRVTYQGFAAAWPDRVAVEKPYSKPWPRPLRFATAWWPERWGADAAWPDGSDEGGYARRLNSLPKYVASTTLDRAAWHNTQLIKADVAEEVSRLKQQPGQDILVLGSGRLVQTLLRHALVDRFQLLVCPCALGRGQRLFADGSAARLKLIDTRTFMSGVVALIYRL